VMITCVEDVLGEREQTKHQSSRALNDPNATGVSLKSASAAPFDIGGNVRLRTLGEGWVPFLGCLEECCLAQAAVACSEKGMNYGVHGPMVKNSEKSGRTEINNQGKLTGAKTVCIRSKDRSTEDTLVMRTSQRGAPMSNNRDSAIGGSGGASKETTADR